MQNNYAHGQSELIASDWSVIAPDYSHEVVVVKDAPFFPIGSVLVVTLHLADDMTPECLGPIVARA